MSRPPTSRWTLNRAGIINVYQYDDETLHFAGGRLLLRGVNGSGKSTAMNMLLPFLLDADARRIDAAGEQSQILQSWMLSGRDDAQPIGYLWIEFERDNGIELEHLVCGCGIKANRASNSVNTWWFVTSKRPGIDLALVESRVPLSAEQLRATMGATGVLFRHDQRSGYRNEIRQRLYGGGELEQHIRLLHVVRNPRVGDRIDDELAAYLSDALPQLSDAALDDAAQPLEDLEEHRHNVHELTRTSASLRGFHTLYSDYARTELHRRAAQAVSAHNDVISRRRDAAQAEQRRAIAMTGEHDARTLVDELVTRAASLESELRALTDQPAYRDGLALDDLRQQVQSLAEWVTRAQRDETQSRDRRLRSAESTRRSLHAFDADRAVVASASSELATLAATLRIERPSDMAAPEVEPAVERLGSIVPLAGEADLRLATGSFDAAPARTAIATVLAGTDARGHDVREVDSLLDVVDQRETALRSAERNREFGEQLLRAATVAVDEASARLGAAFARWTDDVTTWCAQVDEHAGQRRIDGLDSATDHLRADRSAERSVLYSALRGLVDRLSDERSSVVAQLEATLRAHETERVALQAIVDELATRTLPDPPRQPWQRAVVDRGHGVFVLAEVIDFHDHVSAEERAGIEAAMEASGLLGAEVRADGLALVAGELVVVPEHPEEHALAGATPLDAYLRVTVPLDAINAKACEATVARFLGSTATSPETAIAGCVISPDGSFRIGPLAGRSTKIAAEHIGVTARRDAIERARADAAERLRAHLAVIAEVSAEVAQCRTLRDEARSLRDRLPPTAPVDQATHVLATSQDGLTTAEENLVERIKATAVADAAHADAVDVAHRRAATLQLRAERAALRATSDDLREARALCTRITENLGAVARSHTSWVTSGDQWVRDTEAHHESIVHTRERQADHGVQAARLATLEDSMGATWTDLMATISQCRSDVGATDQKLSESRVTLESAIRDAQDRAAEAVAAAERRTSAENRAVAELPRLRQALGVAGLLDAARYVTSTPDVNTVEPGETPPAAAPPSAIDAAVDDTADGAAALAQAIQRDVPKPDREGVNADSVRQSLRQRRDQLGAGWDAEDRQPDDDVPISIAIVGPLGRMTLHDADEAVAAQLRQQASLLTARQEQALRNLLQGRIAKEVAEKLHAAGTLVKLMNNRLTSVRTSHGIGASLRWRRRDDLDAALTETIELLSHPPDLRTAEQDQALAAALSTRIDAARAERGAPYRELIADVLDYRRWHHMTVLLHRPGMPDERLSRRTKLSEGEKKMVSYLPLFAAVAASCDALAERAPDAPRFVLLDDAFAKVSEDNHPRLFGLLVELELDFIATSERLWGTYATVPELMTTEVLRDADLGVIVLEHSRWDGTQIAMDLR